MNPNTRKYVIFGVFAAVSLVLDQWTKIWARKVLQPLIAAGGPERMKTVITGYFDLQYSENRGVAFGMFQTLPGGQVILTVVALAAFALVVHYLRKTDPALVRLQVALGLVAGGAIGNLADRIAHGKVTDFILWHVRDKFHWPNFNVADAALVIGVGLMAIDMFKGDNKAAVADPPATETSAKGS